MNRRPRRSTAAQTAAPGFVRIIGGRLRGSKLPVPDRAGLRPTADRMRETLFNWLAPVVDGARVLDAFAGSGALGFEAASRGAASVLMIERDPTLAAGLRAEATRLGAGEVEVQCADALAWLRRPPDRRFDLVFLDPPFGSGLLDQALVLLPPWLVPGAWVYLEHGHDAAAPDAPWLALHREARSREARCALHRAVP